MYAYFPIQWSFGDEPSDGDGGAAVKDAGAIYVRMEDDDEFIEPRNDRYALVLKTSLTEIVTDFIDSSRVGGSGVTHLDSVPASDLLAAQFRVLADLLDTAKTAPK